MDLYLSPFQSKRPGTLDPGPCAETSTMGGKLVANGSSCLGLLVSDSLASSDKECGGNDRELSCFAVFVYAAGVCSAVGVAGLGAYGLVSIFYTSLLCSPRSTLRKHKVGVLITLLILSLIAGWCVGFFSSKRLLNNNNVSQSIPCSLDVLDLCRIVCNPRRRPGAGIHYHTGIFILDGGNIN